MVDRILASPEGLCCIELVKLQTCPQYSFRYLGERSVTNVRIVLSLIKGVH
jgi:hypothetical protein